MQASIANLTFGTEFEVILPRHLHRAAAAAELSRRIGRPVDAVYPASGRNWKIVADGSLRGGNGLEFVSPCNPPLSGQEGLDQVAQVARALQDMGAVVNSSCGFHVHVGAAGMSLDHFKTLIKLYGRFEEAIDSIMPASRRGNDATYCKSVKLLPTANLEQARSITQLTQSLMYASRAAGSRYHKVNLDAVSKHGTVEFRQHAGTVDAAKAVNWVITCLKLVAAAKAGKTGEGEMIAVDHAAFALKTRAVLEMCGRPEGATIREICDRFGFSVVSVKKHATLAGASYTKRGERYFVTATVAAPGSKAVPATLDGLATLIEATPEERTFLTTRRAILAR